MYNISLIFFLLSSICLGAQYEAPNKKQSCHTIHFCKKLIAQPSFCKKKFTAFWGDLNGDGKIEAWCTKKKKGKK